MVCLQVARVLRLIIPPLGLGRNPLRQLPLVWGIGGGWGAASYVAALQNKVVFFGVTGTTAEVDFQELAVTTATPQVQVHRVLACFLPCQDSPQPTELGDRSGSAPAHRRMVLSSTLVVATSLPSIQAFNSRGLSQ